jgi:hypothetical protein
MMSSLLHHQLTLFHTTDTYVVTLYVYSTSFKVSRAGKSAVVDHNSKRSSGGRRAPQDRGRLLSVVRIEVCED